MKTNTNREMQKAKRAIESISISLDGLSFGTPPQYMCPKHGIITAVITFTDTKKQNQHFCIECLTNFFDEYIGRVHLWEDELTKHDFEISPPSSKK